MAKPIRFPFADAGDRSAVADETDSGGVVTYQSGYPPQYSADLQSDPSARRLNRDRFNQIMFDITSNIQQWQRVLYPSFITAAENGGVAVSYRQGQIVDDGTIARVSLVNNNTEDVANNSNWANAFPWPISLGGTGGSTPEIARTNLGVVNASTSERGIVELATNPQTREGSSVVLAVTPDGLESAVREAGNVRTSLHNALPDASLTVQGVVELATLAETILDDATRAITPAGFREHTFGVNQTLTDETLNRVLGATNYTNLTSKIRIVMVRASDGDGQAAHLLPRIDGNVVLEDRFTGPTGTAPLISALLLVPPGATYGMGSDGNEVLVSWWEY